MFRKFRSALLRGLVVVLPIGFTIWLLWWLSSSTESLLRRLILLVIPPEHYLPGMGIAAALVLLLAAGTLFNAMLVQGALASWERFLDRIPVVKTVYLAIRDFLRFFPSSGHSHDLRRVVLVPFGPGKVIGFVTAESGSVLGVPGHDEAVGVYLPMSYMIGGYTVFVPRNLLEPTTLTVEAGMRLALMGGVQSASPSTSAAH